MTIILFLSIHDTETGGDKAPASVSFLIEKQEMVQNFLF